MKIKHPEKPEILKWITKKTWDNLSLKEKDYFIFKYEFWFEKEKIMRLLYLTSSWSYKNFLYRIKKITKKDLQNKYY